jgi:alpha-L-rhamnosidase
MVAPVKVAGDDGGPAWADAGVICPWTIYKVYGDRRVLERQYPSMVKFVEFCRKRSTPDLLPPKQFHCFGDWLSINADTPKDVIYMAYFAHSAFLTSQAAGVLGKAEDETKYKRLFERIRDTFRREYIGPDGRIKGDTQTAYVLALALGLVERRASDAGNEFKRTANHLVEHIEKRDHHLSTGFIGTKSLMEALLIINRNDVAFRLLHNDTFPSWGFSIKQGATSIWERWDGWTPEKGFQDPGMNSFAHYSFGAVYAWMARTIGGIHLDAPLKMLLIMPKFDPRLSWARTSYRSPYGTIATSWNRDRERVDLEVTIPANTKAMVWLPLDAGDVTEGGRPIGRAEGVSDTAPVDDAGNLRQGMPFSVESGTYRFAMKVR